MLHSTRLSMVFVLFIATSLLFFVNIFNNLRCGEEIIERPQKGGVLLKRTKPIVTNVFNKNLLG
jgi:hypothetical protein